MKKRTYRKKNVLLLTAIPVLLLLGYVFSFSKTIALHEENERLKSYDGQKDNLPLKIATVRKRIQTLDSQRRLSQQCKAKPPGISGP